MGADIIHPSGTKIEIGNKGVFYIENGSQRYRIKGTLDGFIRWNLDSSGDTIPQTLMNVRNGSELEAIQIDGTLIRARYTP